MVHRNRKDVGGVENRALEPKGTEVMVQAQGRDTGAAPTLLWMVCVMGSGSAGSLFRDHPGQPLWELQHVHLKIRVLPALEDGTRGPSSEQEQPELARDSLRAVRSRPAVAGPTCGPTLPSAAATLE